MKSSQSGSEEEFNIFNGTLNSMKQNGEIKSQNLLKSITSLKQLPNSNKYSDLKEFPHQMPSLLKASEEEKNFHSKPELRTVLTKNEMNKSKGNSSGNIRNSRTSGSHRSSRGGNSVKNKENIQIKGKPKSGSNSSFESGSQGKTKPNYFFNGKSEVNQLYLENEKDKGKPRENGEQPESRKIRAEKMNLKNVLAWQERQLAPDTNLKNEIGQTISQVVRTSNTSGTTSFLFTNSKSKYEKRSSREGEISVLRISEAPKNQFFVPKEGDLKNEGGLETNKERGSLERNRNNLSFERIIEKEENLSNFKEETNKKKDENLMLKHLLNSEEDWRKEKSPKQRESTKLSKEQDKETFGFPNRRKERDFFHQEQVARGCYPGESDYYLSHSQSFAKEGFPRFNSYREQMHFDRGSRKEEEKFYAKVNLEKLSPLRFESRLRRDSRYLKNRHRFNDFYDNEFEDMRRNPLTPQSYAEKLRESDRREQYWREKQKALNQKIQIYEEKLRKMGMLHKRRSHGEKRDRKLIREIYENMPNSGQVTANPSPKVLPGIIEEWKREKKPTRFAREMLGKRSKMGEEYLRGDLVMKKRLKKEKWDDDEEWNFEEEKQAQKRPKRSQKKPEHLRKEFKINLKIENPKINAQSASKFKNSPTESKDEPATEMKKGKRKRVRRRKPLVFKNNNPNMVVGISCKCKKSRCLKLYCECFSNDGFCHPSCQCDNCCNREEFKELKELVRKEILQKNPKAFQKKFKKVKRKEGFLHSRGCNCKKTECLKNYCECFSVGIGCSTLCKCLNCKNKKLDIAPQEAKKYFEKPERKRRKPTILYEYILDQIKDKDAQELSSTVDLAITNDYERILDEIKNNYDPRKLQKHIKKVNVHGSDGSGSGSRKKIVYYEKQESLSLSEDLGTESVIPEKNNWVEDQNIIVDEDDDEDDLANTMEKFKKLRQE